MYKKSDSRKCRKYFWKDDNIQEADDEMNFFV